MIRYFVEPSVAKPLMLARVEWPGTAERIIPSDTTWTTVRSLFTMLDTSDGAEVDAMTAASIAGSWGATIGTTVKSRPHTWHGAKQIITVDPTAIVQHKVADIHGNKLDGALGIYVQGKPVVASDVAAFINAQRARLDAWEGTITRLMQAHFARERTVVLAKLNSQKTRRAFIELKKGVEGEGEALAAARAERLAKATENAATAKDQEAQRQEVQQGQETEAQAEEQVAKNAVDTHELLAAAEKLADSIFNTDQYKDQLRTDARNWLRSATNDFSGAEKLRLGLGTMMNTDSIGDAFDEQINRIVGVEDTTYQAIKDALFNAMTSGDSTVGDLTSAVESVFSNAAGYRAEMIGRTEAAGASSTAALNVANSAATETGLSFTKSWLATDGTCCDICQDNVDAGPLSMDDTFPSGDDAPPAHPNAVFAGSTFVPYNGLIEMVSAQYDGPAVRISASGQVTTIGPNHPMMTRRGMVAASQLHEGDELLYDSRVNLRARNIMPKSSSDPDSHRYSEQMPLVEDAFKAALSGGGYSGVTSAGHDLHGDRVFCQPEIQVVRPERYLLPIWDSLRVEELREGDLVGSYSQAQVLSGDGTLFQSGDRILLASPGGVGGCGSGRAHMAWIRVESIEETSFKGMAFDATTSASLYCSDGFVISNCRCAIMTGTEPLDASDINPDVPGFAAGTLDAEGNFVSADSGDDSGDDTKSLLQRIIEYKGGDNAGEVGWEWSGNAGSADGTKPLDWQLDTIQPSQHKIRSYCKDNFTVPKLDDLEEGAVGEYKSGDTKAINGSLRGDTIDPSRLDKTTVDELNQVIASSTLNTDTVVYRGMGTNLEGLRVGSTITDKAYQSTSLVREEARVFATGTDAHGRVRVAQIDLKAGQHAFPFPAVERDREAEVLLPANTSLKVTSISTEENYVMYHMEVSDAR